MAKGICKHCRGTFIRIYQHEDTCISNPEMHEKIRLYLYEHAEDGMIMKKSTYQHESVGTGLPAYTRLEMTIRSEEHTSELQSH